jgi:phenylalanyl-tRNA synthetase beta chain
MRIDGYDNIEIPGHITITPAVDTDGYKQACREKAANYLVGLGFNEIFTNSITNQAFYSEDELANSVKMLNSLSAELNMMRPSMLETGLLSVAHNLNRKNNELRFYEFGKTYSTSGPGKYEEQEHLSFYITGRTGSDSWKGKAAESDLYYLKGAVQRTLQLLGWEEVVFAAPDAHSKLDYALTASVKGQAVAILGAVKKPILGRFDIKQPVWYADLNWELILKGVKKLAVKAIGLPRQLPVQRDLALVVPRSTAYEALEKTLQKIRLDKLKDVQLFDVFESEKLGAGKKSFAVSFTFLDEEKTLTDKEIDGMMSRIMTTMEKELNAEIRK